MTIMSRYRSALGFSGIPRVMAASFICRLLAGMVSLALLLAAKEETGSYATAGFVGGGYAFALAFTSPLWGRVADRFGPRTALATATSLQSLAFILFVVVIAATDVGLVLVGIAFLAGAATPPSAAVANTVLMRVVPDGDARRTLFAMAGLFTESVFIVGPLIVAAIVAVVPALYAVAAAAVFSSIGTWWLRGAPAMRALEGGRTQLASRWGIDWTGRQPRIMFVITTAAFAIGALQVSVVARAEDLGISAGILLSVLAAGGVVGSFLYGGIKLPGALPLQLLLSLSGYGLLIATMGVVPGVIIGAVVLFLVGAVNGPADAIESVLVGEHTTAGAQQQAFAVLISANWVGFAAGSATAGAVLQHLSARFGVLCAALGAFVAAGALITWAISASRAEPHAEPSPIGSSTTG